MAGSERSEFTETPLAEISQQKSRRLTDGSKIEPSGSRMNIASALDEVTYEIERYSENLERLHSRISPVLHDNADGMSEDPNMKEGPSSNSDLQNELRNRARRMRDLNNALHLLVERVDL